VTALVGAAWLMVSMLQMIGSHRLHASPPLAAWLIMTLLMMVPVTLPAIRHLAFNSFRSRRSRAMTLYLAAYLFAWLVFGAVAISVVSAGASVGVPVPAMAVAILLVAAAWQLAPSRQRALRSCRRTVPLPPTGWRADAACARFAIQQAMHCMKICWPVMLLMAAIGHALLPMFALTALVTAEEQAPWRDRLFSPVAVVFLAAALVIAAS
jgi:predicted metal-binding membrane protein